MKNTNILVCVALQFGVGVGNQLLTNAAARCDNAGVKSALKGSFFHRIGIGRPPADINYRDEYERSALHYAAYMNCVENVKTLLSSGANMDVKDGSGETPLFYAIMKVHLEIVKLLLKAGASVDTKAGFYQETPLHKAVEAVPSYQGGPLEDWNKTDEIVYELLEAGADTETKDRYNRTAIQSIFEPTIAPPENIANKVDAMMKRVSNPNAQDNRFKESLLHSAVSKLWYTPSTEQLTNWDHQVGGPGCLKVVKILIKHGVDPNLLDKRGNTALYDVALYPRKLDYELIKFLLESGTDPDHKHPETGDNILQVVVLEKYEDPKYSAKARGLLKTMEMILENNVDPNSQNNKGESALHQAILTHDDEDIIKLLLEYKADPNMQTNDGNTALHLAIQKEPYNLNIISLLLKNGADTNILNNKGEKVVDEQGKLVLVNKHGKIVL